MNSKLKSLLAIDRLNIPFEIISDREAFHITGGEDRLEKMTRQEEDELRAYFQTSSDNEESLSK